jgi:hypothetical protein
MKKLITYFISQRWHLHSLALLFNFLFFLLVSKYNFMNLQNAYACNECYGSQYFFNAFISLFCSYAVAFCVELYQLGKKANNTAEKWKKYATPDIIFTTIIGFSGYLLELAIFEYQNILKFL